jgi:hypothetical protein
VALTFYVCSIYLSFVTVVLTRRVHSESRSGVAVMVVPLGKVSYLILFVDGLRCTAIKANDRRLRSL